MVGRDPRKKPQNFGADLNQETDPGLFLSTFFDIVRQGNFKHLRQFLRNNDLDQVDLNVFIKGLLNLGGGLNSTECHSNFNCIHWGLWISIS